METVMKIDKKKWDRYHASRKTLIESLRAHIKSCADVNVYHPEFNQSDSHSLMNESMGVSEMNQLAIKLKRDND